MLHATLTKEKLKVFKREMSEYIQGAKSSHIDEAIAAGFGKKSHAALLHKIGDKGWAIPVFVDEYEDEDEVDIYFELPGGMQFWGRLKELSPDAQETPLPPRWSGSSLISWDGNLSYALFSKTLDPRDVIDKDIVGKLGVFIEALRREEHDGLWCRFDEGRPDMIDFGEISIYRAHAQSIGHDKGAIARVSDSALSKAQGKAGLEYLDLHGVVEALGKEAGLYSSDFQISINGHSISAHLYDAGSAGEGNYINQLIWMMNKKPKDGDHYPISDPA